MNLFNQQNQFNSKLLQPSLVFVGGFDNELPLPQVNNPAMISGIVVNKPSSSEITKFQFEDLKEKNTNEAKNIEEVDFGPYRKHREGIIKVARDITILLGILKE